MKKFLLIMLTVILSLILIACAPLGTTTETAADGGSQSTEEAVKLTWPKELLGSVPQLKGITITDITETEDGVSLTYEGGNDNTAKMYIEQLKRADWTFETLNDEVGKTVTCEKPGEHLVFTAEYSGAGSFVYSAE